MIKILYEDDNELKFIFEGPLCLANSLRRIILDEVPVFAIDIMEIYNTTSYPEELILNRLNMLPIDSSDVDNYNFRYNCPNCIAGCTKCGIVFTVEKKGSGMIMSGDIKSDKGKITNLNIPIITLNEDQEMKIVMIATKGTHLNHAKYAACSSCIFRHSLTYTTKEHKEEIDKIFQQCPQTEIEMKNGTPEEFNNIACSECIKKARTISEIKIIDNKNKTFFVLKSAGQLKPKDILLRALKIAIEKFENLSNQL